MRFLLFFSILFLILKAETIQSIKFNNLTYMSESIAKEIINIENGEELNEEKLNKAILNLYKQGYFRDIYATFDNGILEFHVQEKPSIASVEIKGYGTQSEKDTLYGQIGIKKGETFDSIKLENAIDKLKQMLEYKGYYGSVVEPDVQTISDGKAVAITLNVNRGNEIYIEKSYYEGASQLKKRKIEALSANKQRDTMGWLPGLNAGKLVIGELELDKVRIQDSYMRNGFLDIEVSNPLLSVNPTNNKAQLYYNVKEGKQYEIRNINIEIDDSHKKEINEETLKKFITSKTEEVANIQTLRDDAQIIKLKIAALGYAYVNVIPDFKKVDENQTQSKNSDSKKNKKQNIHRPQVDVIYHIDFGKKVKINDVVITGNTRTSDRIIRREILIAPGDIYSLEKIQDSEIALKRIGYFEKVFIEEKRISDDTMDLVVNVQEGRTGELTFGIGYGSFYGLTINGSINERNLFGSGFGLGLSANLSFGGDLSIYGNNSFFTATQQFFNITLTNPRILDSKWGVNFNLYYSRYLNYVYTQESAGFGITVGRLLTPTLRLNLGYDINKTNTFGFFNIFTGEQQTEYQKYYDTGNIQTGNNTSVQGLWGRSYIGWGNAPIRSSLTPSLTFDNTDDYYFPKRGNSTTLSLTIAGIGGDVYYSKLYAKTGFYFDLQKFTKIDLIFRYKAQAGYLFRYNQEHFLPLNDTYYLGGIGSIRGYTSYSVTPLDNQNLRVGGDGIFTNSVELSYGLVPSAKLRISLYADYGFLSYHGSNNNANFKQYGTFSGTSSIIQRGAAGIGIEWVSPFGPIVIVVPMLWYGPTDPLGVGPLKLFTYGTASRIRSGNDYLTNYPSYFELTMGTRF